MTRPKARFAGLALIAALCVGFTLGLTAPAGAGLKEGFAAYHRGDYATARREWRPLAEQGDASAQYNLGVMYSNGEGVPQDYAKAVKWYRKAAEQGNADAQNNLGIMYRNGEGVPQDDAKAPQWWRKAAEQGNAKAQYNLGLMYDNGRGVPQDYAKAVKWYRKAAEQGNADAQNNLGIMYRNGEGVPQDDAKAPQWWRKAAEQGNAKAQYNLGLMYDNGRGVPQDYAKAVKWYRKAAEQGNADAQFFLGFMYDAGRGVPEDYVRAHMWYNLAAAQGDKTATKNRDLIARGMTPTQLAEAQRLARAWRPRKQVAATYSMPDAGGATDNRRRIADIQRGLASLGYDPGPADGILGPKTRAAVRAFQAREGLPVTGTVSASLVAALRSASSAVASAASPAPRSLEKTSTGSGFYVSGQGHVLTNEHVVNGCREVRIPPAASVTIVARDGASDLALLKSPAGKVGAIARFRQGRGIRPGDDIVVVGYPLRGLLASEMNVTTGNVSALAGLGDDRRFFQITAPVQPGNSGGPVLDTAGNAVGVVIGKLNAIRIARATGDIPQNVNFAISAGTARAFLDAQSVSYETAPSIEGLKPADVAAKARRFTVPVECWK